MGLLTQNRELKKDHIWNWTIPAYKVRLETGEMFNVCPNAGACKNFCYARNGTYLFSNVRKKHMANFKATFDIPMFVINMAKEINAKKHIRAIRIHDAGDFYSYEYLQAWIALATARPDLIFYAYTKQISLFKTHLNELPSNFLYIYSTGGLEDHLIDKENDRHAEVFPDEQSLIDAGYFDQSEDDLLAVLAPTNKIGIPANNIRHYLNRMGGQAFTDLQQQTLDGTDG